MTRFGPHTDLVEDVLAIARSGVLTGPFIAPPGEQESVHVVHALDDIDKFRYESANNARIKGRSWRDIYQIDDEVFCLGEADDDIAELNHALYPVLDPIYDDLYKTLLPQLSIILPEVEICTVVGDLFDLVLTRAVRGRLEGSFGERLYSIYKASGYPCGWDGEFPDGRLVVFSL